ncbi:type 1 glutamine amidotransferase domain-containing protein [Lentilactobacillus farraginis]|uniref:C56 family peptidase n=1 Tax=Lentilactobacillus farraginis DSM 18382 = JCM 14108 TaxID=1423743 RepID=X0QGF4_9LACO|nr:type 1 glutamine amidotransferase domain-containing protein [Lentilactobacillus farraginis]KRM05492.1 C56 family peptidase [Lentilactobacillus farraginis DSM 18382 = JCM 14108]GAF37695.1 ThiJ/PfpI family protein [Lentilactobacillus farraginis DSM 18382 = JCM 14108]
MSKIAVIVTNDVEDVEYTSPVEALKNAGHEVVTIENQTGSQITGKHGVAITADKGIADVSPDEFDGLLIPGGFSPDQLRADERFVDFVKAFLLSDKPVFAICHGPQLFIQTGLTKGRTMTAYTTVRPDLYYAGAVVKDQPVVVDQNLVTSRTPDDLDAFNSSMLETLKKNA